MYKNLSTCVSLFLFQESGFCYDPTSKEPQEVLNDCMFREGLTLNVSTFLVYVTVYMSH